MTQPAPPVPEDEVESAHAREPDGAISIDVEQLARLVYQLMLQDQAIERERGAWRRAL
jgi:hypothetical protein